MTMRSFEPPIGTHTGTVLVRMVLGHNRVQEYTRLDSLVLRSNKDNLKQDKRYIDI